MKAKLEHIVNNALVDGHNHEITSREIIHDTVEAIINAYYPIVNSLDESNKIVSNLQSENLDLKIKVDFLLQELALKEDSN